jgi:hypothetical protein
MEPRAVSVATTTRNLSDQNALEIKSTANEHIRSTPSKKIHSDSLPVRRGSTSRATTKRQKLRAIGARIVGTTRNVELDFIGDTRIADWLRRAASQTETYGSRQLETLALSASAARPSEAGDCGRHRQRGGSESGSDEDNV